MPDPGPFFASFDGRVAPPAPDTNQKRKKTWLLTVLSLIGIAPFIIFVGFLFDPQRPVQNLRAFRVPSGSMCPTICANERIIADIAAYKNGAPQRADVIMLSTKFSDALFIKRVIAVGGDTVKQGTAGEILVNGNPLPSISICGKPETGGQSEGEEDIKFDTVKVPEQSFFCGGRRLEE